MRTSFPKPEIDKNEALRLWLTSRSEYAKEQLIFGNIGLIRAVVQSLGLAADDEDAIQTGIIGLMKAIESFNQQPDKDDQSRGWIAFAVKCVRNHIINYLIKNTPEPMLSLDEIIKTEDGENISRADMIPDGTDQEKDIVISMEVSQIVDSLPEKKKLCLKMHIAGYRQDEIAKKVGVSDRGVRCIMTSLHKQVRKREKQKE